MHRVRKIQIVVTMFILLAVAHPLPASHSPTRPVSIGVNANFDHHLARSANLGWSRKDIFWSGIQPTPGAWDTGALNGQINTAIANGQQVLAILHVTPPWLTADGDIPPYSTAEWSEFVRRLAAEFRGRIAAYEIWNEPDQKSINWGRNPDGSPIDGIGWGRDVEEPPLFIDFVRAAAIEIRAQAPGTPVVAPAFMSRNDANGADNRKRRILQQAEGTWYPDGQGTSFIDVVSVHNNAGGTESNTTMGWRLNYENLAYVWNHAPSMRHRPIWVTEYGWMSNAVGEAGQREKICNVTKAYTGAFGVGDLDDWDVRRAFIFALWDPTNSSSRTIFRSNGSAKPVVTQYLQFLPYPAVQQPINSPACAGTGLTGPVTTSTDARAALADHGLRDPRAAVPSGFRDLAVNRSSDGLSTEVLFADEKRGRISVVVSKTSPESDARGVLNDAAAEWTSGDRKISISGLTDDGMPLGKSVVRSMAATLDPSFGGACMVETIRSDDNGVRRFGFSAPRAPNGFTAKAAKIEYTHPTLGCGAQVATHTEDLDFLWTFTDAAGNVYRAGIYRYGRSFAGTHFGERSLHWQGKGRARFWVAADAAVAHPDQEVLRSIAESMDPVFGEKPSRNRQR